MTEITNKVERAIARFERVTQHLDERKGPAQLAANRERRRLNASAGRTLMQIAVVAALLWLAAAIVGLVHPIGMSGFLALLLATGIAAAILIARGGRAMITPPRPSPDLPGPALVDRFDSYIHRARPALPPAAQAQLDSISSALPGLRETVERVDTLDPTVQDARRLMATHLPLLIERYGRVPAAFREERDGEGKTVDERLVDGLEAGRAALSEIASKLARADVAALETQGRFIEARYGDERIGN